jgi:site-specific DNA-methyltransferase (adenine-specific)
MITDPPFSPHVHANTVSASASGGQNLRGVERRDLGFEALDDGTRTWLMQAAGAVARWSVIYSDVESTHKLRELAAHKDVATKSLAGRARYLRTIAWIRWSSPQLAGDRPPQGREDVCVFNADPLLDVSLFWGTQAGPKAWNGPGNLTHLDHKCLRGAGKHKAEKPLDQLLDLVSWFSEPGETVFDPFAGSGTTGLACSLLGRNFVGCELSPEWAANATARIQAHLSDRDRERLRRWFEPRDYGDVTTGPTGVIREAARARDRAIVLADPRVAPFARELIAA